MKTSVILVDIDQGIFLFTGSERETNLFWKAVRNMVTRETLADFYKNTALNIMTSEIQACNFSRKS